MFIGKCTYLCVFSFLFNIFFLYVSGTSYIFWSLLLQMNYIPDENRSFSHPFVFSSLFML